MKKQAWIWMAWMACGAALAKLPPPSPEAQAEAAAAKAKSAWGDKVATYKLCLVQDRIAARYRKEKGTGKPAAEVPPCADPGPYTPPAAAAAEPASNPAAPVKQ